MKNSIIVILIISFTVSFSQNGKVYLKNPVLKIGVENTYIYEPPKSLEIPEDSKVKMVSDFDFPRKLVSLIKKGNSYEFSLKVPDSVRTIILTIKNKKGIIDTNQDLGYTVFLNTKNDIEVVKCKLNAIALAEYANYYLKLKIDSTPEKQLSEYNIIYEKYPKLREDKSYVSYLYLKYSIDKEKTIPEIVEFANFCKKKNSEDYLRKASQFYGLLKMNEEKEQMDKLILEKYPLGQTSKYKFLSEFSQHPDKTETYILESLETYKKKYNDKSENSNFPFYYSLTKLSIEQKDLAKFDKYEVLMADKTAVANLCNNSAWELSGQDLTSPAPDLIFAEKLSKKSLDIIIELQKQSDEPNELQVDYNQFTDTYALILYKQNKFEEAFQYEDAINQLGGLDTGGKERYAGMLEKVKGSDATKEYIEKEFANGLDSNVLLNHLHEIYVKLNLPLNDFEKIKEKSLLAVNSKTSAAIIEKLGSTKAIDFSLKNSAGKEIKLSDYKGKVIVLDFWATWCGPCKASFPKMQELVDKYKNKDVEFFFIDTWERTKEGETVKNVNTLLKDKKYTFNVLFDFKDEITAIYKIQSIPSKIVIDKDGIIISINSSEENITFLIDQQLN